MLQVSLYIKKQVWWFFHWKIRSDFSANLSPSRTNNKFDLELKKIKNSANPLSCRKPIGTPRISLLTVRDFF